MGRKAFIDPITQALKCHGFVATNQPGDIALDVADDFSLEPNKWKWNGSAWIFYTPPLTPEEIDVAAARADNAISALKTMTPAQARAWVGTNVNTLADAKSLLATLAAIVCVLARRL